jgi:3'-5' exonuclease
VQTTGVQEIMKIVLDIETLQAPRAEWASLQDKNPDAIIGDNEFSGDDSAQLEKDYQKSSFDATFSRIICIGLITFTDDLSLVSTEALYGSNEKALLERFWIRLDDSKTKLIITHNGLGFDLPFLKKRSIINRVKPSMEINLVRYRTEPVYDTMAVWANWDTRGFVKLNVLAHALGVESKSGSGDQVADMWISGKQKDVAEYCLQDVYVTYACYCRMTFQEPLKSSEVFKNKTLYKVD